MVLDRTYDCAEYEKVHMALESEKVHMALKILNRAKEEVEFAANIQEELWQGSHDEQVQKIGIHLDSIRSRLVGAQKSLNDIDEK